MPGRRSEVWLAGISGDGFKNIDSQSANWTPPKVAMWEVLAWFGLNFLVLIGEGTQQYKGRLAQFSDLEYRLLWANGGYGLALLGMIFHTQILPIVR